MVGLTCRFAHSRSGNFAIIAGLLAPVLLGITGGAVDVFIYTHHKSELQDAVDGAAVAAAKEASLGGWT